MWDDSGLRLPSEILLKILNYLPSEEVLKLYSSCSNKYLKSLLTDRIVIRCLDFCSNKCAVNSKELKEYLSANAGQVKYLCLNHYACKLIQPEKFFAKFHLLTELHVKECGFPLTSVIQQIPELNLLQVFSWSFLDVPSRDRNIEYQDHWKISKSIRKVNLDVLWSSINSLLHLLYIFSKVTHMQINIYSIDTADTGFTVRTERQAPACLEFSNLHSCVIPVIEHGLGRMRDNIILRNNYCSLLLYLNNYRNKSLNWQCLDVWDDMNSLNDYDFKNTPPEKQCTFLPFLKINEEAHVDILEKTISNSAGESIKYLVLNNFSCADQFSLEMLNFFNRLISLCTNLTEVNFSCMHNIYPGYNSILNCILTLHGLKRLAINCCFIPTLHTIYPTERAMKRKLEFMYQQTCEEGRQIEQPFLSKLNEACPFLVELEIRSDSGSLTNCNCGNPINGLKDVDLIPILQMQKLENLTLKDINSVVKLDFLKKLFEKCHMLKTLCLASLGPQGLCLYWPILAPTLGMMINLQEFCIEHNQLPLESSTFWQSLGRSPSLRSLCIIAVNFSGKLNPQFIANFVLSVPTLRTLHIHCRAINFKKCSSFISSQLKNVKVNVEIDHVKYPNARFPFCTKNIYETHRMCYKVSTVGIPVEHCGLPR